MPDSPIVVLGIQDPRTREWIRSIVVDAGFPVIVKDGPEDLYDLTPDGTFHFVIGETGEDPAALDELYRRLMEQFRGHWDKILVIGILQRRMADRWWFKWCATDRWWFKWCADYGELPKAISIAQSDWNEWRNLIPGALRAIAKELKPP